MVNSEAPRQVYCWLFARSYYLYQLRCELAFRTSTGVFGPANQFEMLRIHTTSNAAQVIEIHPSGHTPNLFFIYVAMRRCSRCVTVTRSRIYVPLPYPAESGVASIFL